MDIRDFVSGRSVMITGGTGSFGYQIVSELAEMSPRQIVIASRDEKKQYDMHNHFSEYRDILRTRLVDVRDFDRLRESMKGVDIVFHAAALKQVPNCESHPIEAVKTNVLGAENVRRAAILSDVSAVVSISTDKAVKPVNAMGMTKALQEKIMLNQENPTQRTRFVVVRYGNVLGSRGSVVPYFVQMALSKKPLPVTNPEMTRFILTLPQAVNLVFHALMNGEQGDLYVKKMPACKVIDVARVIGRRLGGSVDYPLNIIGTRPGEKIHEVLVSEEEMRRADESDDYYRVASSPETLNGNCNDGLREYTSLSTYQMTMNEVETLLEANGWFSTDAPHLGQG